MAQNQELNDIRGRLVLITGASGGSCSEEFAKNDCHLALHYSSGLDNIKSLVGNLIAKYSVILLNSKQLFPDYAEPPQSSDNIKVSIHQADLSTIDGPIQLVKEAKEVHGGSVEILVSNAGYGKRIVNVWDIPVEEWDKTININLRATFLLTKAVSEDMRDHKWGRIIFVSSLAAYGGGVNGCHYASSKGGMQGMMRNLSTRLAPWNISVNDVSPALVRATGMIPDENYIPGLTDTIPLKRLCQPQEVANVVIMFAKTGFATGQSLLVAGGLK